jgi:hypothetical protein
LIGLKDRFAPKIIFITQTERLECKVLCQAHFFAAGSAKFNAVFWFAFIL